MQARAELLEAVNAWASVALPEYGGAYLTAGFKPNRRLLVVLAQAPGESTLKDMTKEYSLTFRAYEVPYWEEANAQSTTIGTGASSAAGAILVGGSVRTPANVTLRNISGATINTATINIGGNIMSFSSLGLGANQSLVITHTNKGILRITAGSANAMSKRAATSADDFMIRPGSNGISFSAQRACQMTVSWRSRFL